MESEQMHKPETVYTRRGLLRALATVSMLALVARQQPAPVSAPVDDIVEIDGWILRRSDLA